MMNTSETTTDIPKKTRGSASKAVTKVRDTTRRVRHISLGLVGLAIDTAQMVASRSESRGRRFEREIKSQREELTGRVENLRKEAGDTLMHTSDKLAERGQALADKLGLRRRTYSTEVTHTESVEVSIDVDPPIATSETESESAS